MRCNYLIDLLCKGTNMKLELKNDLVIKCDSCGEIHTIDKDSLLEETFGCERQMGEEIQYVFSGESKCDCGNDMTYSILVCEYPYGCLNYEECNCEGAVALQTPSAEFTESEYNEFE